MPYDSHFVLLIHVSCVNRCSKLTLSPLRPVETRNHEMCFGGRIYCPQCPTNKWFYDWDELPEVFSEKWPVPLIAAHGQVKVHGQDSAQPLAFSRLSLILIAFLRFKTLPPKLLSNRDSKTKKRSRSRFSTSFSWTQRPRWSVSKLTSTVVEVRQHAPNHERKNPQKHETKNVSWICFVFFSN